MDLKQRGRPRGPSRRYLANDNVTLSAVAVALRANPDLEFATALKRMGVFEDTVHRRLKRRWNKEAAAFRATAETKPTPKAATYDFAMLAKTIGKIPDPLADLRRAMTAMSGLPEWLRLRETAFRIHSDPNVAKALATMRNPALQMQFNSAASQAREALRIVDESRREICALMPTALAACKTMDE
jgi:hypothetical protein